MPFKLIAPIEKTFHLVETDAKYNSSQSEDDQTTVTIRQAATRQNSKRSDTFNEIIRETSRDGGADRLIFRYSWQVMMRVEARLTMSGCNIIGRNGKPLFKFLSTGELNMSDDEFDRAWGELPLEVSKEIHDKVLEVNPDWKIGEDNSSLGE